MGDNRYENVTRFEVIDDAGRALVAWPCNVELSLQDRGLTLKVFVTGVDSPAYMREPPASAPPAVMCVACEQGHHVQCLGGRCECIHSSASAPPEPRLRELIRHVGCGSLDEFAMCPECAEIRILLGERLRTVHVNPKESE